jgi:hypothetical protein
LHNLAAQSRETIDRATMLRVTFATVVVVFACSPSSPSSVQSGDDAPVQMSDGDVADSVDALLANDACTSLATSRCTQLMTCSVADLDKAYGTMAECLARELLACDDALAVPDTGSTPGGQVACGSAIAAETCAVFLSGTVPAECDAVGPGTGTCAYAAQCATSFCAIGANALCGLCQAEPVAGASCAANGCGESLVCNSKLVCIAPAQLGKTCNATTPCDNGMACVGTGGTGTCKALIATLGASCDSTHKTLPPCNGDLGLTCSEATEKCVAQPIVPAGSACGIVNSIDTACGSGAKCNIPASQTKGTCVAPAADGSACDTKNGPDCLFPARCIPTAPPATAGTCQLAGSISC